jgi:4'-phosphopantetheinyl transferase
MPLFLQKQLIPEGLLGIWMINEGEEYFRELMPLRELEEEQMQKIRGKRRVEWLAGRWMLHVLSGRKVRGECLKDDCGKPYLKDSTYHISISHSRDLAAVIGSPLSVGIDIQAFVPKIERLAPKFVRQDEEDFLQPSTRLEQLHVIWGAKEVLYTAFGRRKLDFREHLILQPFHFSPPFGKLKGSIRKEDINMDFELVYELFEDYFLVYGQEAQSGPDLSPLTIEGMRG